MPVCFLCNKVINPIRALFKHFECFHPQHTFLSYNCAEKQCTRVFHLKNSFRKHLLLHFKSSDGQPQERVNDTEFPMPTTSTTVETNSFTLNDFPPTETPSNDISIQCDNNHTSPRNTFYHSLLSCVSSLYGNPTIPRNCVQHVVKH